MTGKGRGTTRVHGRGRRPFIPSSSHAQVPSSGTNTSSDMHTSPSSPPHSPTPHVGHRPMPPSNYAHMSPQNHRHVPPPYPPYPNQSTFIPTPGYYGGYHYPPHPFVHPPQYPTMHFSSSASSNIMHTASSSHQASPSLEETQNRIHIEPTGDT